MEYTFYLGETMLPVPPERVTISVKNRNKTVSLINDGEINLLKQPGLSEISFRALLPNVKYPFARYREDEFADASFFLGELERLKGAGEPFRLIISRIGEDGRLLFDTDMPVSLESYTVIESVNDGCDAAVEVNMKQYRHFGGKAVGVEPPRESSPAAVGIGSTVVVNGRLHRNSYGAGGGRTLYDYRGKINFINEKGTHPYHVTDMSGGWLGWVLRECVTGVA